MPCLQQHVAYRIVWSSICMSGRLKHDLSIVCRLNYLVLDRSCPQWNTKGSPQAAEIGPATWTLNNRRSQ